VTGGEPEGEGEEVTGEEGEEVTLDQRKNERNRPYWQKQDLGI